MLATTENPLLRSFIATLRSSVASTKHSSKLQGTDAKFVSMMFFYLHRLVKYTPSRLRSNSLSIQRQD